MAVRPSMIKFQSRHTALEVCRGAAWVPATLNYQVILILAFRGVHAEVFLDRLRESMKELDEMMHSREVAEKTLSFQGQQSSPLMRVALNMLRSGFTPRDPHLGAMLEAFRETRLTEMKVRMAPSCPRLHVPHPRAPRLVSHGLR